MRFSIALMCFALFACQLHAEVPQEEREALIDFYHALGGDDWIENDGWLGEAGTECSWFGIYCISVSGEGGTELHVHWIWLDANNVRGKLSEAQIMSRLPHLTTLSLFDNALTGPIPQEYIEPPESPTRRWWSLILSHNQLTGTLPDVVGGLPMEMGVSILLSDNRLTGPLPPSWSRLKRMRNLMLDHNQLSGELPASWSAWAGLEVLTLDHNNLSGELPAEWGAWPALYRLELSENDLSGTLPEWLGQLEVSWLNLQGNRFEGSIAHAISAFRLSPPGTSFAGDLDLSHNRFSGPIPDRLMDLTHFPPANRPETGYYGFTRGVPSLNLCGNDLEVTSDEMLDFLERHHIGAGVAGCFGRERMPFDATVSGSWYDPARSGEGFVLQMLNDGELVAYWFTYPVWWGAFHTPELPPSVLGPWQMWAFQRLNVSDSGFSKQGFYQPQGGRFSLGGSESDYSVGAGDTPRAEMFRVGPKRMHVGADITNGGSSFSHRNDLVQLTRLAGTTCENRQPHQWISGLWYDPERSGEGFVVEVVEDGRGVVYWFTYSRPGPYFGAIHPAWMMGDGEFDGTTLHIDNLIQPVGTQFGGRFDRDDIDRVHWGTLTMEFHDDGYGHVYWDSVLDGYDTGDYPLRRLSRPMLADCTGD